MQKSAELGINTDKCTLGLHQLQRPVRSRVQISKTTDNAKDGADQMQAHSEGGK